MLFTKGDSKLSSDQKTSTGDSKIEKNSKLPSMHQLQKNSQSQPVGDRSQGKFVLARKLSPEDDENELKNITLSLVQKQSKHQSEHVSSSTIKNWNIFDNKNHLNSQYVEFNKGPRFREGKVVSYSVVGSPSMFAKYMQNNQTSQKLERRLSSFGELPQQMIRQQQKKKSQRVNNGESENTSPMHSSNNKRNSISQSCNFSENAMSDSRSNFVQTKGEHKTSFKVAQSISNIGGNTGMSFHNTKKKVKATEYQEQSKAELLNEMAETKKRMQREEARLQKFLSCLSTEQQHQFTREQRVIDKFNQNLDSTCKYMEKLAEKGHRKPEQLLMLKSEEVHRKKIELQAANQAFMAPEQKLGRRIWYLGLRKGDQQRKKEESEEEVILSQTNIRSFSNAMQIEKQKNKDPLAFNTNDWNTSDIFSNFTTLAKDNSLRTLEVVRKSIGERNYLHIPDEEINNSHSTNILAKSIFSNQINNRKLSLQNSYLQSPDSQLRKMIVNNENIFSSKINFISQIEGKSVYEKELESLKKDGNSQNHKYEKVDFIKAVQIAQKIEKDTPKEPASLLDQEQVFAKSYDMISLTKTGKHFFKDIQI